MRILSDKINFSDRNMTQYTTWKNNYEYTKYFVKKEN